MFCLDITRIWSNPYAGMIRLSGVAILMKDVLKCIVMDVGGQYVQHHWIQLTIAPFVSS